MTDTRAQIDVPNDVSYSDYEISLWLYCYVIRDNSLTTVIIDLVEVMLAINCAPPLLQESSTPLYLAAYCGKLEVVKVLLSHGANRHLRNRVSVSVVIHCCCVVCSTVMLWSSVVHVMY